MIRVAILTISDGVARGTREDRSGPKLREHAESLGWTVKGIEVIPDERDQIAMRLKTLAGSGDVARFLLDEARVAVVPGADFGSDAHIRMSYATSAALISEGLARMASALKTLG